MAVYESENGKLSLTLKDEPTQRELETFEKTVQEIIKNQETDGVAFRANFTAAFRAGWVERVDGGPGAEAEILDANAQVVTQFGRWAYQHYLIIKLPDPNW